MSFQAQAAETRHHCSCRRASFRWPPDATTARTRRAALHRPRRCADYYKDIATSIEYSEHGAGAAASRRPRRSSRTRSPIAPRTKSGISRWPRPFSWRSPTTRSFASAGAVQLLARQRTDGNPEQPAFGLRFGHSGKRACCFGGARRRGRPQRLRRAVDQRPSPSDTTKRSEQRRPSRRSACRPSARPIHGQSQLVVIQNVRQRRSVVLEQRHELRRHELPAVLFPSSYNGFVRAEYTQPLWAGSGVEFTRIATPLGSGVSRRHAASARAWPSPESTKTLRWPISNSPSSTLLRDTENAYWNLYLQYRLYHTAVVAHNSALRSWREAYAKLKAGGVTGFTPVDEAHGPRPALQHAGHGRTDAEPTSTRTKPICGGCWDCRSTTAGSFARRRAADREIRSRLVQLPDRRPHPPRRAADAEMDHQESRTAVASRQEPGSSDS